MILGLDASTSVCGWCVLNNDGSVAQAGHVAFQSSQTLYERLRELKMFLLSLQSFSQVFIEEPKKMFANKSTAHVIGLLQRWNGMVSAMLSEHFCDPVLVNERSARKLVGIHIPYRCANAKQLVVEHVRGLNVLPQNIWQTKKTGKLKDHCLDIADAYVVARAGFLRGPITVP